MDGFIGMIQMFGFIFAPAKWALCGGQVISISQQTALYSLLGTWFGGDGRVTFGYPNLTSRVPVGFNMGGGIGLTPYNMGQKGGFEDITLTVAQMPQHNHLATFTPTAGSAVSVTVEASAGGGTLPTPSTGSYLAGTVDGSGTPYATYTNTPVSPVALGGVTATGGGGSGTVAISDNGNSSSHENRQPFQAMNFSLCEDGIYPSRN